MSITRTRISTTPTMMDLLTVMKSHQAATLLLAILMEMVLWTALILTRQLKHLLLMLIRTVFLTATRTIGSEVWRQPILQQIAIRPVLLFRRKYSPESIRQMVH